MLFGILDSLTEIYSSFANLKVLGISFNSLLGWLAFFFVMRIIIKNLTTGDD